MHWSAETFDVEASSYPFAESVQAIVKNNAADVGADVNDIYITDPPYGDAVKYEEILDFFIAWLRKNPPTESRAGCGTAGGAWRSRGTTKRSAATWWPRTAAWPS